MIKFLLIVFLVSYLLYKVGGFLFRMFFISLTQQQRTSANQKQTKTSRNGNVDIQFANDQKKRSNKGFEGGEYVDYEEVKD